MIKIDIEKSRPETINLIIIFRVFPFFLPSTLTPSRIKAPKIRHPIEMKSNNSPIPFKLIFLHCTCS